MFHLFINEFLKALKATYDFDIFIIYLCTEPEKYITSNLKPI